IGTQVMPAPLIDWREIALDPVRRRVRLPAGAKLDLGGIVKGWAADIALDRFFAGFENVLINASGDMRARGGAHPDEPWAVGIGDPHSLPDGDGAEGRNVAIVALGQGGTATSGATERWWYAGGVARHHLIDPRTGTPAQVWLHTGVPSPDGKDLIA